MGALLLRVGIDIGSGGCLAPIFGDGSFEYIPIPEGATTSEALTYSHHPGRIHTSLASSLPARLHESIPHRDPEFETFTYGDPTPIKRRQLLKLVPGDLLVFYAGLKPPDGIHIPDLFIIGYFIVGEVHDFSRIREDKPGPALERLSSNTHVKRKRPDKGLVIVEGDPRHSWLLSRALPLGDAAGHVLATSFLLERAESSEQRDSRATVAAEIRTSIRPSGSAEQEPAAGDSCPQGTLLSRCLCS